MTGVGRLRRFPVSAADLRGPEEMSGADTWNTHMWNTHMCPFAINGQQNSLVNCRPLA